MNDTDLNHLFGRWGQWCRERRLYAPSPNPKSIIGTLRMPGGLNERPDAENDAELARLHLAILAQGDRGKLIIAHYYFRPYNKYRVGTDTENKPIFRRKLVKEMAHAAGMRPESWNRSVRRACRAAYEAMRHMPLEADEPAVLAEDRVTEMVA